MTSFDPNIEIKLGDSLPFLWEQFTKILGKDSASIDLKRWFYELQQIGWNESATVQCIGMHTPLPLEDIYRPTKLRWQVDVLSIPNTRGKPTRIELPRNNVHPEAFLQINTSAVIKAGPGWGKTTFLHYLFLHSFGIPGTIPLLITLRRPEGIPDLARLVEALSENAKITNDASILLLVDGYDEISLQMQRRVSSLLNRFMALRLGRMYLSCRDFYDVLELHIPTVKISPFDEEDQRHYVRTFMKASGGRIEPDELLKELKNRGLQDLLEHPLLLALVCIVKSGSSSVFSKSVLILIERALETLSFRWDEGKGISREQHFPLDGRSRIHCLMRIAYMAAKPIVDDRLVMRCAKEQLEMLRWEELDERQVMLETARFYGILVPTGGEVWQFVHKTIHDYLAARFMIQSGIFDASKVSEWNSRFAYAACLGLDATPSLIAALKNRDSFPAFMEMLSNDAPFDHLLLVKALWDAYESDKDSHIYRPKGANSVAVSLSQNFFSVASVKFLRDITELCSTERSPARDTYFAYAAAELIRRSQKVSKATYIQSRRIYGPNFVFEIDRRKDGYRQTGTRVGIRQLIPD